MNNRVKKIARNIMFLLSIPLLIFAFVFANIKSQKDICNGLDIQMANPALSFVTKDDIIDIVTNEGVVPLETLVKDIHIHQLEESIEENKWIEQANIFISANRMIHVQVQQREPKLRVVEKDSSDYSYYLDQYANAIEWSPKYAPRIPIVTVQNLGYTHKDLKLKSDLVTLANFISKDSFWNVAISQIDVTPTYQIHLIPTIGNQIILLGDISQLDNKMKRLFAFYQQGLFKVNWDKYDEIDLRFKGQLVCRNSRGEKISEDPYGDAEQKILKTNMAKEKLEATAKQAQTLSAKPTTKDKVKSNSKKEIPLKPSLHKDEKLKASADKAQTIKKEVSTNKQ